MDNTFLNMRSLLKKLFSLLALLLVSGWCFTQDGEIDTLPYFDTTTTVDSVYIGTASEVDPKFDSLTANDIPTYHAYSIPDSVLERLKKDDAFWYANKVPKRQKPEKVDFKNYKAPFYTQAWFRTLIWIIIIGAFIAVLVWFLIASDVKLFRSKPAKIVSDTEVELTEDIFSVKYEEELEKAIANNNYRLGVRLMYLHILRLFSDNNIIQYKIEKTNSDYLLQLYNTAYYKDFFRLTRNFEYVWYGKFEISSAAFDMIGQDYKNLKGML